jgi:phage-related baseplate assembly protein
MGESTKKVPSKEPTIQEAEYTVEELAAASEAVIGKGIMPECVIAAFRVAGVEKATKTEAKKIVTKFMTKEVK